MLKFLLISGSPRKGNTEFILDRIFKNIKSSEKEIVLLRKSKIEGCRGCLYCGKNNRCAIKDGMKEIYNKVRKAEILVIGTPNYFDSVSGLLKNFIDRTNPFYGDRDESGLKNKKIIFIVVGGGKIKNSKRVGETTLKYFSEAHEMKLIQTYYFQALEAGETENNPKAINDIDKIIKKINSL